MRKKILWITQTALMLALLVTLQYLTKPLGQLVTGSFVNAVLAISVLAGGLSSGLTVALISPVMAFLLGIAPQIVTVPAIMAGNCVFVTVLYVLSGREGRKPLWKILGWLAAAAAKFAVLYAIVGWVICGLLADALLAAGTLKPPMLTALPATFGWMQLVTALIGGAVAMPMAALVRKAIKK